MKKQITLLLPFFLIISCSIINLPQNTDNSGEIKVSFKFPQKNSGFNIKAIPENTDYMEISVFTNKANIKEAIHKTIKKSDADEKTGEAKVSLKKLTVGEKYVEVRAYDQGNKILASAREKTVIKPNNVVKVVLELKTGDLPELKDEKINNPRGIPSGNLPPKLDASGKPLPPNPSPSGILSPKPIISGTPLPLNPSPSGILSPKPIISGTPLPLNPSPSGILSPKPIISGTPLPPKLNPSGSLPPPPIKP